ncbi:MAG: hypothetical protein MUF60_00930 [Vicinamibacterales bacterium]|nr:hypothetical protein [Vicinamibacterales bacterium]
MDTRRYRAGDIVEDRCLACKLDRLHSVIVADSEGRPLRTQCDYCGSQHNYRGLAAPAARQAAAAARPAASPARDAFPTVADAECQLAFQEEDAVPVSAAELERLLRRIVREEAGVSPVVPAEKWRGGTLVLRPGNGSQEKAWPIETFFHKVVMIRNRLRTLEQQVNASDLPEEAKVRLQSYVTACYGSLTSFNVLFADDADQFKGGGD